MPSSLSMGFSLYMKFILRRANPERVTADWRAVCGRTACTVRRAGRTLVLPDPYQRHVAVIRFIELGASIVPVTLVHLII